MTDLEDLEEIAEASAFGFHGLVQPGAPRYGRTPSEKCGAGHPWTVESTRFYKDRGRTRRLCRICDKLRARLRLASSKLQAGGKHGLAAEND